MTYHTAAADIPLRDQSITERVFENLETRPNEVVLTDGMTGATMTAAEFMEQVKQLAGGLTARGMGAGKTIALMAPNIPHYCVVFHAVAWAGGTITTINPTYTQSEVAHQLRDSGADLLISIPMFLETAQGAAKDAADQPVVVIGEAEGAEPLSAYYGAPIEAQVPIDLDEHYVILPYSSGTTGLPKGVCLSHRNLVVNTDQVIVSGELRKGEVAAAFLPFFHIYGMNVLMNVHLAGGGALAVDAVIWKTDAE